MSAPKFTSVGCYPIIYVSNKGTVLCGDCVEVDGHENEAFTPDVHWEGEPITCDECSEAIESAYGEP